MENKLVKSVVKRSDFRTEEFKGSSRSRKLAALKTLRFTDSDPRNNNDLVVSGYAAVFNERSHLLRENRREFREVIKPGAFKAVLESKPDIRGLVDHVSWLIQGRTSSGTLDIFEDELGLRFDIKFPNTAFGRHFYTLVKRGDISQSSFAFASLPENREWSEDGQLVTIKQVDYIQDVSIVGFPAYEGTIVIPSRQENRNRNQIRLMRLRLAAAR